MPLDTDIEGFFETYVVSSPDGKNRVTVPKDIRDVLGDNTFTLYAPSNEPELLYLIPERKRREAT
jgi:DNA-binding transcriptional regulator/RsmH inhibitor MraZ